jgi:hypothetical protein
MLATGSVGAVDATVSVSSFLFCLILKKITLTINIARMINIFLRTLCFFIKSLISLSFYFNVRYGFHQHPNVINLAGGSGPFPEKKQKEKAALSSSL